MINFYIFEMWLYILIIGMFGIAIINLCRVLIPEILHIRFIQWHLTLIKLLLQQW